MSRLITQIKNIQKYSGILLKYRPDLDSKTLKYLGFYKIVADGCKEHGIFTLKDLREMAAFLPGMYSDNYDRIKSIARNLKKVAMFSLTTEQYEECLSSKKKTTTQKSYTQSITKHKTKISGKRNHKIVDFREALHDSKLRELSLMSKGCCLCLTFNELIKISENDFISIMKNNYKNICDKKLESSRISSWRDEYRQITNIFVPIFCRNDRRNLDFHIIFELMLPLDPKDLELDKHVYADAVIVGDHGVVVLEFKRLDSSTIQYDSKQASKYMHRLRYHKAVRKQKFRYTYIVYTKEKDNKVYCYGEKRDFWFGNSNAVAEDICSEYFDKDYPINNISKWLTAGFWQKRRK